MKKTLVVMLVVFAILCSMLPTNVAFAAKAAPSVKVTVRNQTGGVISMSMTDSIGNPYFFSFSKPDTASVTVKGGIYTYFAFTPCGIQKGSFNLTRNKVLIIACTSAGSRDLVLRHLQ